MAKEIEDLKKEIDILKKNHVKDYNKLWLMIDQLRKKLKAKKGAK